jgi:predicted DNA-binding WGR domain protein
MKKYLEYKDEKSSKFWQIETSGKSYTVVYGKTGTAGQPPQTKEFASPEEAEKEAAKKLASKIKEGYKETAK